MLKKMLLLATVLLVSVTIVTAQGTSTGTSTTTASDTKTKKPAVFRPTKDQIKQVQSILKGKKLYTGEASGTYNDDTRTGIKGFQKDNGLKETGTLNRATLEKFGVALTDNQKTIPVSPNSLATSKSDSTTKSKSRSTTAKDSGGTSTTASKSDGNPPKKPAPFRAGADQVTAAQKILKDGKLYTGETNGKLDDATRDSLKKYQGANKLNATGTLNAATLEKMGIALTDAQKANVAAQAAYDAAKKK